MIILFTFDTYDVESNKSQQAFTVSSFVVDGFVSVICFIRFSPPTMKMEVYSMIIIFKSACFNTGKCPVLTWAQLQWLGNPVLVLSAAKLFDQLDFLLS